MRMALLLPPAQLQSQLEGCSERERTTAGWTQRRRISRFAGAKPGLKPAWHIRTRRAARWGNFANVFLFVRKTIRQAKHANSFLAAGVIFSSSCGYLLSIQISFLFSLTFSLRNKDDLLLILLFQLAILKEHMLVQESESNITYLGSNKTMRQSKMSPRDVLLSLHNSSLLENAITCISRFFKIRKWNNNNKVFWAVQHLVQRI